MNGVLDRSIISFHVPVTVTIIYFNVFSLYTVSDSHFAFSLKAFKSKRLVNDSFFVNNWIIQCDRNCFLMDFSILMFDINPLADSYIMCVCFACFCEINNSFAFRRKQLLIVLCPYQNTPF